MNERKIVSTASSVELSEMFERVEQRAASAEAERDLLFIAMCQILGIAIDAYKPTRDMKVIEAVARDALKPSPISDVPDRIQGESNE